MSKLKIVLVIWASIATGSLLAQTFVYTDQQMIWSQMACHVDRGLVRTGSDWRGEIAYTVEKDEIFTGFSTSVFDLAYTYREGKLYIGDSYFTDAISYTFDEGKIYVGDSTFPLDLAYTIRPNLNYNGVLNVYIEDSISPLDIVAFMQGAPTEAEIFALLLTLALL